MSDLPPARALKPGVPSPRPSDASALILVDRTKGEPRVLMGRRHNRHTFMPSLWAFPGGKVDPPDARAWTWATFSDADQARLMHRTVRATRRKAHALGVAALRETLEETGLAIGRRGAMPVEQARVWPCHARTNLVPSLDQLRFVARAVTPPGQKRRYDCRFFMAETPGVRIETAAPPSGELESLDWIPLSRLSRLDLPRITQIVLKEVDARLRGAPGPYPIPFHYMRGKTFRRDLIRDVAMATTGR